MASSSASGSPRLSHDVGEAGSSKSTGQASSSRGAIGNASRNRGIKVNTLPTWVKSVHDDDALFADPSPSPLTSRAAKPRSPDPPPASSLPKPPPASKQPDRTERHADAVSPTVSRADSELVPRRPDPGSRRGSLDFWGGKWASGWRQHASGPSSTTPAGGGTGDGQGLEMVDEKGEARAGQATAPTGPSGDWWQFTLPVKYRRKVEDYWHSRSHDPEKSAAGGGGGGGSSEEETAVGSAGATTTTSGDGLMRQRSHGMPFSMHYPTTPGWSTPWAAPFTRSLSRMAGDPSDPWSDLDRRDINRPSSLRSQTRTETVVGRFRSFLLTHYAAPLVLRMLNLIFSAATLGLVARIRVEEIRGSYLGTDLVGVVGSSTTFALVIIPPSLVYILIATWAEYFGPPLGIWRVSRKMIFTLLELVLISVWSAEVALALDDEFTTPLQCTAYTPNSLFRGTPLNTSQIDGATATTLCNLQSSVVALVMVAILLYAAVLVVSLFRIFMKVSRKR